MPRPTCTRRDGGGLWAREQVPVATGLRWSLLGACQRGVARQRLHGLPLEGGSVPSALGSSAVPGAVSSPQAFSLPPRNPAASSPANIRQLPSAPVSSPPQVSSPMSSAARVEPAGRGCFRSPRNGRRGRREPARMSISVSNALFSRRRRLSWRRRPTRGMSRAGRRKLSNSASRFCYLITTVRHLQGLRRHPHCLRLS